MPILDSTPPKRQGWGSTWWTQISGLKRPRGPEWDVAWDYLVAAYQVPMERYVRAILIRITGSKSLADKAPDIVQDFFATCLEKEWLARADRERGRFRAFARKLLRLYTLGHLRWANAAKRSPGLGVHTYEIMEGDRVDAVTPEEHAEIEDFDRSWFKVAFDRAVQRLGEKHKHERYQQVILDLLATGGEVSEDLKERVGIPPEKRLDLLVHRARKRFGAFLVEELSQTVTDQEAFEQEYAELLRFLP